MSEFSNTAEKRIADLTAFMLGLINNEKGADLVKHYGIITENYIPTDVLSTFEKLFELNVPVEAMKIPSNKLFNILFNTLSAYPALKATTNSFIDLLIKDNAGITNKLHDCRANIKQLNKAYQPEIAAKLAISFKEIEKFTQHYTVKENVLFPLLEKNWSNHACVKLMWSFHDDIRRNIAKTIEILNNSEFDLQQFNKVSSQVYFNINTIIFREEKLLFPVMLETMSTDMLNQMLNETAEMGLPFVEVKPVQTTESGMQRTDEFIQFSTGELTIAQAELVFNTLPVDITFVDENDTVRFYSNPPHRIFPRTPAIIGRKVQNCHPPESVHVVNEIVASFKAGTRNVASFWLHLGPKYILIQYYAMRNKQGEYKGVLEVSQEISEIQQITGDKKLL